MDSNQALADLANALDEASLTAVADRVDKIAQNTAVIKSAQYVGVQGYWIRNKRCWENCYRQKRAQNKDMPAQKVWTSCHSEYLKSLNNDNSDWNKYAGKDDINIKKFAAVNNYKRIIASEKDYFNSKLTDRIKQKWPIGNAVYDVLETGAGRRENSLLSEANKVAKVAEDLKKAGYKDLSIQASSIVNDIIKESQALNNLKGIGNQISNWWGQRQNPANFGHGNLLSMISQLENTLNGYKTQKQKIQKTLEDAKNYGGPVDLINQMVPLLTTLNKTNIGKLKELANQLEGKTQAQPAPARVNVPSTSGGMTEEKAQKADASIPEIDQEIEQNMQTPQDLNGDGMPDSTPLPGNSQGVVSAPTGSWNDVQSGEVNPQGFEGEGFGAENTPSRAGGPEVVRPMNPMQTAVPGSQINPMQTAVPGSQKAVSKKKKNPYPLSQKNVPKKKLNPYPLSQNVAKKNDLVGRVALGSVLKRIKTY